MSIKNISLGVAVYLNKFGEVVYINNKTVHFLNNYHHTGNIVHIVVLCYCVIFSYRIDILNFQYPSTLLGAIHYKK